jgi:hypothetical protein
MTRGALQIPVSGITHGLGTAKSHFRHPTLLTRDEARRIAADIALGTHGALTTGTMIGGTLAANCAACALGKRKSTKLSCRTTQRGEWWTGKRLAPSARAVLRAANSPGAFLNRAHDGLASILLAIVTDGPSIVGKSLEVEYRLAPRRPEVAAHPIGDHVLPLGV